MAINLDLLEDQMRVRYSFSSRKVRELDEHNQHRKEFPKLALEVIRISDLILEILDARFPEETRNPELEKLIKEQGKKLLYVLNKSDLIDITEAKKKIEVSDMKPYVFISCLDRRGSRDLRERIKIELKGIKEFEKKHVGIIGYPNTGKSSVINILVGKASAKTAAEAGFTKGIQKLRLSAGILLLDTPGVIPEKEDSNISKKDLTKHAQIGVRTYDKVKEPDMIVHELMKKFPGIFEKFYKIETIGDSELLIETIGRTKGILRKGNQVDIDRTARRILKDWQEGKIKQ